MSAFLARSALRSLQSLQANALPCLTVASRGMAIDQSIKDREHAAESLYFNKQEEKVLRDLLKKLKSQADKVRFLFGDPFWLHMY
jgi:hypothetical protein